MLQRILEYACLYTSSTSNLPSITSNLPSIYNLPVVVDFHDSLLWRLCSHWYYNLVFLYSKEKIVSMSTLFKSQIVSSQIQILRLSRIRF